MPNTSIFQTLLVTWQPLQAEGGDNHGSPAFFRGLAEICKNHDISLMMDEVLHHYHHQHHPPHHPDHPYHPHPPDHSGANRGWSHREDVVPRALRHRGRRRLLLQEDGVRRCVPQHGAQVLPGSSFRNWNYFKPSWIYLQAPTSWQNPEHLGWRSTQNHHSWTGRK